MREYKINNKLYRLNLFTSIQKNEAYFFLIEKGLVDEFREYVARTRNEKSDTTQTYFIMKRV